MYTLKYYSTVKENDIMPFTVIWMDLEITILNDISQKDKAKYRVLSLLCRIFKM